VPNEGSETFAVTALAAGVAFVGTGFSEILIFVAAAITITIFGYRFFMRLTGRAGVKRKKD
jgi:hypothetical protein